MAKLISILSVFLLVLVSLTNSQNFLPPEENKLEADFQKCFQDLKDVQTEIETFLARQNITWEDVIGEFPKLNAMFASMMSDCGLSKTQMTSLEAQSLGTNWVQCVTDFAGLAPLITQFVLDIASGSLDGIIKDLSQIVQQVGVIIKDCFESP